MALHFLEVFRSEFARLSARRSAEVIAFFTIQFIFITITKGKWHNFKRSRNQIIASDCIPLCFVGFKNFPWSRGFVYRLFLPVKSVWSIPTNQSVPLYSDSHFDEFPRFLEKWNRVVMWMRESWWPLSETKIVWTRKYGKITLRLVDSIFHYVFGSRKPCLVSSQEILFRLEYLAVLSLFWTQCVCVCHVISWRSPSPTAGSCVENTCKIMKKGLDLPWQNRKVVWHAINCWVYRHLWTWWFRC